MFQDDPEVLPLCVRVSPYVFIRVSLYPTRICCVQTERETEKEKKKRGSKLSGWGGVREGRMDVFDG